LRKTSKGLNIADNPFQDESLQETTIKGARQVFEYLRNREANVHLPTSCTLSRKGSFSRLKLSDMKKNRRSSSDRGASNSSALARHSFITGSLRLRAPSPTPLSRARLLSSAHRERSTSLSLSPKLHRLRRQAEKKKAKSMDFATDSSSLTNNDWEREGKRRAEHPQDSLPLLSFNLEEMENDDTVTSLITPTSSLIL